MVRDNSLSAKILNVFVHVCMAAVLIMCILPLLNIVAYSFSSSYAVYTGGITLFPKEFSLAGYKAIFQDAIVPRAFLNSVMITVIGTAVNLAMTIATAYPLSKRHLPFRKTYMFLIVATMFFGGGLIPTFILINSLGMYNSFAALIVPLAINVWNMLILMSFFRSFPVELEESAMLDGAGDLRVMLQIILPLSMAGIVTIGLFYAVSHWNSYFQSLIYLRDTNKYPLQLILREIVIEQKMASELASRTGLDQKPTSSESVKYSTLVVSIVPMLIVYPYIQKFFVKGVMIGSLKG